MKKLRIAIIGTRGIGRRHARAVLQAGGELRACAARTRSSAISFASAYGVPFATTDAMEIAGLDDVDAAVICTPNCLHAPQAQALLAAGKDVLVEKPMAMNASEAEAISRAAGKHGRVVMVGHMWRFSPEVNFVRELVGRGAIGEVVRTTSYGIHVGWGPTGWFTDQKLAGGGALADMGVHAIDTARYLIGDPKPQRVYASVGTHYGDYNVDDTGVVMITWKNGATSVIECGWRQPHADRPYAGAQVYGTAGYAALFPTEVRTTAAGKSGVFHPRPPRTSTDLQQIYDRQMERFFQCIRSREPACPGPEEGLVNMRIVDAAYLSARTGRAVRVQPIKTKKGK